MGVALVLVFAIGGVATPPPERAVRQPTEPADPSQKKATEIRWHLDRNTIHDVQVVRAVDIGKLQPEELASRQSPFPGTPKGEPELAIWQKKSDDPALKFANGYGPVVDEKVFSDLRKVRGELADKLEPAGVVVGRVKATKFDPVRLVQFLVTSGVIDANLHVDATITGTHYTADSGDWFALHSDDLFTTMRTSTISYNFGVHIAKDGTIRLHRHADVGRLPAKVADEKTFEK